MIEPQLAVTIALGLRRGATPAGVSTDGEGYVVDFRHDGDSSSNLSVYVDGTTGEAHTVSAGEYRRLSPHLHPL